MSDKTDVILAVALKPIGAKAQYLLYIKKSKVSPLLLLLTAFFCRYIRLALTPPWGFFKICLVDTILEIHPWSLCLHRDLLQYLERRENYLLVFLVLCRYTNPVDHHLPALCLPWVGDNWLVIIRHYYGYYFHFKESWRCTVQGYRRKGIFRKMHTSCWWAKSIA